MTKFKIGFLLTIMFICIVYALLYYDHNHKNINDLTLGRPEITADSSSVCDKYRNISCHMLPYFRFIEDKKAGELV